MKNISGWRYRHSAGRQPPHLAVHLLYVHARERAVSVPARQQLPPADLRGGRGGREEGQHLQDPVHLRPQLPAPRQQRGQWRHPDRAPAPARGPAAPRPRPAPAPARPPSAPAAAAASAEVRAGRVHQLQPRNLLPAAARPRARARHGRQAASRGSAARPRGAGGARPRGGSQRRRARGQPRRSEWPSAGGGAGPGAGRGARGGAASGQPPPAAASVQLPQHPAAQPVRFVRPLVASALGDPAR